MDEFINREKNFMEGVQEFLILLTKKNEKLNNINSFISIGGIINNEFNLIVKEKDNKRSSFLGYKKDNKYITVLLNLEI